MINLTDSPRICLTLIIARSWSETASTPTINNHAATIRGPPGSGESQGGGDSERYAERTVPSVLAADLHLTPVVSLSTDSALQRRPW